MKTKYNLYSITLDVPFQCPILSVAPSDSVPDVTIIEDNVPLSLENAVLEGNNWQAAPGRFLLLGGRFAGRFLVENGNRITFHRNRAAKDETLCAFLLSTVIVALLRQRGNLVLHANVVMTQRGAVAISGESGAGKSTALGALMARGCRMVTDDVAVLSLGSDGLVMVLPGISKLNLCEDAAEKLGHDIVSVQRNPLRRDKVTIPVNSSDMVVSPVQLKKIFMLSRYPGKFVNITHLTGSDKFLNQQKCIYGPLFPEEHPIMFSFIRALAEQVEMTLIERPAKGCSVVNVAEAILHG